MATTHQGFVESIYFIIITATTVGFGDIIPITSPGRAVAGI
jgi:voltage-gated potassium channel Kch